MFILQNDLFAVRQAYMHTNIKDLNLKSELFIVFVGLKDEKFKKFKKNHFAS